MEFRLVHPKVPKHWEDDAEEIDVSLPEYVRRMARAGRRQWGFVHTEEPDTPQLNVDESMAESTTDASGSAVDLQDAILRVLSTTDGLDEAELTELVLDDLQSQIEQELQELKDADEVDYHLDKGGWVKKR